MTATLELLKVLHIRGCQKKSNYTLQTPALIYIDGFEVECTGGKGIGVCWSILRCQFELNQLELEVEVMWSSSRW